LPRSRDFFYDTRDVAVYPRGASARNFSGESVMGLIKEFKEFALRGNVVDLAVGFIMGGAFGKIVSTLVDKVMMPPLNALKSGAIEAAKGAAQVAAPGSIPPAGREAVAAAAASAPTAPAAVPAPTGQLDFLAFPIRGEDGSVLAKVELGLFLNTVIEFVIVAGCLFLLIKAINTLKRKQAAIPTPPPRQEVLLEEIRDALKSRG
jgi:large conductance mechanosensitive channel